MLRPRLSFIAALTLAFTSAHASPTRGPAPVEVTVEGAVQAPGRYGLREGARIGDAISAAKPRVDAYLPASMLMTAAKRREQVRARAGLQYDLHALQTSGPAAIHAQAARLAEWLEVHEATGRVLAQPLDVRLMQVQKEINPEAHAGDRVVYMHRPDVVRVIGAVSEHCLLPHQPLDDVTEYVQACGRDRTADPEWIYAIQPDGVVQQIGIALWNRADANTIAPGGTIYVPLAQRYVKSIDPEFNAQFADFVATQAPATQDSP